MSPNKMTYSTVFMAGKQRSNVKSINMGLGGIDDIATVHIKTKCIARTSDKS